MSDTKSIFETRIIASQKATVENEIQKFQRRMTRKGFDASTISYSFGEKFIGKVFDETIEGTRKMEVMMLKVELTLPRIEYEDYEYVATLKAEKAGNLVYTTDKFAGEDMSRYFQANFRCDHCGTNRNRKTVHIFRNDEGKELMIASTCSAEYFGVDVDSYIQGIASWNNFVKAYYPRDIDGVCGYGVGGNSIDTHEIFNLAYGVITRDGYYKKSTYDEMGTIDTVNYYTNDSIQRRADFHGRSAVEADIAERERILAMTAKNNFDIDTFVEYWENYQPQNDFEQNCRVSVFSDDPKESMLVMAVYSYLKKIQLDEKRENEKKALESFKNEHIGDVSEKLELDITVEKVIYIDGYYGASNLVISHLDDGRCITFFDKKLTELEEGQKISITGKVKEHKERDGRKQTVMFYVKIK